MTVSASGGRHYGGSSNDKSNPEPSAPPLDGEESPINPPKYDNNATAEAKEITTSKSFHTNCCENCCCPEMLQ